MPRCWGGGGGGVGGGGGGGQGQQLCVTLVAVTQILEKVLTKSVVVHAHLSVIQRRLVIKGLASTV